MPRSHGALRRLRGTDRGLSLGEEETATAAAEAESRPGHAHFRRRVPRTERRRPRSAPVCRGGLSKVVSLRFLRFHSRDSQTQPPTPFRPGVQQPEALQPQGPGARVRHHAFKARVSPSSRRTRDPEEPALPYLGTWVRRLFPRDTLSRAQPCPPSPEESGSQASPPSNPGGRSPSSHLFP